MGVAEADWSTVIFAPWVPEQPLKLAAKTLLDARISGAPVVENGADYSLISVLDTGLAHCC